MNPSRSPNSASGNGESSQDILQKGGRDVVNTLRRQQLLDQFGAVSGRVVDGKFYPVPDMNRVASMLDPYLEKIMKLQDPVIVVLPDTDTYTTKDINRVDPKVQLRKYAFREDRSVFYPSMHAMPSERQFDKKSLKEVFSVANGDDVKKIPPHGHHYERPFGGWNVFVCERELHEQPVVGMQKLEQIIQWAGVESPFLQLTAKEAAFLRTLGLNSNHPDQAEALLGQYNPWDDTFPVMTCRAPSPTGQLDLEVSSVNSKASLGSEITVTTGNKPKLMVRRGFRLMNLTSVAKKFIVDKLEQDQEYIQRLVSEGLGMSIVTPQIPSQVQNLGSPRDNFTILSVAVNAFRDRLFQVLDETVQFAQERSGSASKFAIEKAGLERQLNALRDTNGGLREAFRTQKDEIVRLKDEVGRLQRAAEVKTAHESHDKGTRSAVFNLMPDDLELLTIDQLKKLQKALIGALHPDKFQDPQMNEWATKKLKALNSKIDGAIKRKGG